MVVLVVLAVVEISGKFPKLFALRDTRRGTWRQALGGLEAQKLGGSDALILATSWIFLMASGELPTIMFMKRL